MALLSIVNLTLLLISSIHTKNVTSPPVPTQIIRYKLHYTPSYTPQPTLDYDYLEGFD